MTSSPAQEFRTLLAAAADVARTDLPLRALVQRRAPLASQGQQRGHLDALLRLSCHGDGHGTGVLVFDWPTAARGHSVLRLLEDFHERHGNDGHDGNGTLRIEYRETSTDSDGEPAVASAHLKVLFDAAAIPDEMLDLLGLAHRMNLLQLAREEIRRYPPAKPAPAPAPAPAAARNGVHIPAAKAAAPKPAASKVTGPKPTAEQTPARPAAPHPDQDKIDRIVNHANFDGDLHPHVNPNGEVTNSNGEVFRLIMRRSAGGLRRQWTRIGKELAPS